MYTVEDILRKERRRGKMFYLIKWKGYPETTWQPSADVRHLLRQSHWTFKKE